MPRQGGAGGAERAPSPLSPPSLPPARLEGMGVTVLAMPFPFGLGGEGWARRSWPAREQDINSPTRCRCAVPPVFL